VTVGSMGEGSAAVPPAIERFVRQLVVTYKAVMLYPPASAIPRDNGETSEAYLKDALAEQPELRFGVTKTGLVYDGAMVFPDQSAFVRFAKELYNRNLSEVRFHSGAGMRDIVSFLGVMRAEPAEILQAGGFESRLWELGVDNITITEAQVTFIDKPDGDAEASDDLTEHLSTSEIDELISAAYAGRSRDQRVLTRFIGAGGGVSTYLRDVFAAMQSAGAGVLAATERFSELAEIAAKQPPEERAELYRQLGDELGRLDPELRRHLLTDRLLPEAKTSDAVAAVVRQMDLDEVCDMLVEGVEPSEASHEGLSRAIRNLAMISMASREEVHNAAGASMRGAGMSEQVVSAVLESAAPSKLEVKERKSADAKDQTVDTIFKLMDLAPTAQHDDLDDDVEVRTLREEAARGISDGDVVSALVTLATLDAREQQFATTLSLLEDSLDLLIERGDFETAAFAAATLKDAAESAELTEEQKLRLRHAIGLLGKPQDVKLISQVLRVYPEDSPEHAAALQLVSILGPVAIHPMLEQLAEEPDMTSRKQIIDLLTDLAGDYVDELGQHVSDDRWYFVRNVVGLLGSTKSAGAVPYLERTIRHPDARVRREVIRAAAGIPDPRSVEILIAGLSDDDGQNVQLAARYLAGTGERRTIRWLEQVALGDGTGNRDVPARAEAIEALGKLGAVEAVPALESIAGRRSVFGGGKNRELRAAATSALERIREAGGGS
jgi:HEAT repeats